MPTLTYTYSCSPPHEGGEAVAEQMSLAHRYRNDLARCERDRRAAAEALLRERCPDLVAADLALTAAQEAVETLVREARRRNARERTRLPVPRGPLREARRAVREARLRQRELRRAAYADGTLQEALRAIDAAARDRARGLRGESGLYWANYQFVEEAMGAAHRGGPPSFLRWTGRGTAAVHLQGEPTPAEEILACGRNDVRLEEGPRPGKAVLRLRVGSTREPGRRPRPVWAACRVHYHRPLPPGSSVSWVRLVRRRYGTRYRYEAQFVVDPRKDEAAAEPNGAPHPGEGAQAAGVDLGWRLLQGGTLRVASWVGEDGRTGEVTLSQALLERHRYPDHLESIRDLLFDGVRAVLVAWLGGEGKPAWLGEHLTWLAGRRDRLKPHMVGETAAWRALDAAWWPLREPRRVPAWLEERTSGIASWRSQDRLARLVLDWRDQRFPGDEGIYHALEAWRNRDRHLYDWAAFQRRGVQRSRRDLFRKVAFRLAAQYGILFVEDTNWREIQARPEVDEAEEYGAREYARVAAVGDLLKCLREKTKVIAVPAEDTTALCHACGGRCEWDQARELRHRCEHCGADWDQDENAARNLLARGRAGGSPEEGPPAAPPVKKSRRNRKSVRAGGEDAAGLAG